MTITIENAILNHVYDYFQISGNYDKLILLFKPKIIDNGAFKSMFKLCDIYAKIAYKLLNFNIFSNTYMRILHIICIFIVFFR